MRQNALLFPALFNFNDVLPHFLFLRTKPKADENLRKLHDHPVKTGQCNILLYCAPSCLPAGRDPAHPAIGGTGHVPVMRERVRLFLPSSGELSGH